MSKKAKPEQMTKMRGTAMAGLPDAVDARGRIILFGDDRATGLPGGAAHASTVARQLIGVMVS